MEKIVEEFEPGRTYSQHEVNQILLEFHEDVATLRRELIASGLMERDNGNYWREGGEGGGTPTVIISV